MDKLHKANAEEEAAVRALNSYIANQEEANGPLIKRVQIDLELWVFRSPNFVFRDASSLAAAGKNSIGRFYRSFSQKVLINSNFKIYIKLKTTWKELSAMM